MRKIILMMLLAVVSSNAMAEWVAVGEDKIQTVYANPATIRKDENKVKFWGMFDFKKTQKDGGIKFLSFKTQFELDCKEESIREIATTWYSDNMGKGDVVPVPSIPDVFPEPVVPDSMGEFLFNFACGKK
jgi:hypothetical protein